MMAVEHKKRVVNRKARQKQALQPEVRPQEIRQEDMTKAANPTITNTQALAKLLEKQDEDLNLFEWLINPNSFRWVSLGVDRGCGDANGFLVDIVRAWKILVS
jgi:hypothetical protein